MKVIENKIGLSSEVLNQICDVFASFDEINSAVLFGSRAKGNFKPYSDIDLALKGNVSFTLRGRIDSALDDLLLPYKIDLLVYTTIGNVELVDHIDRVGITLYEKK